MGAPFSDVREWTECSCCRNGNWLRAHITGDAFAPCPRCGQPPRCQVAAGKDGQCDRPGTVEPYPGMVTPLGQSGYTICGQHHEDKALTSDLEEWELAAKWVAAFQRQAKELADGWALNEALGLAALACETGLASTENRRRAVWGEDG